MQKENSDLKVENRVLQLQMKKLEDKVQILENSNSDVVIKQYTEMEQTVQQISNEYNELKTENMQLKVKLE